MKPVRETISAGIIQSDQSTLELRSADDRQWFKVYTINALLDILKRNNEPYMLVAGDTAHGTRFVCHYPLNCKCISLTRRLSAEE